MTLRKNKKENEKRTMLQRKLHEGFEILDIGTNGERPGDIRINNDRFYYCLTKFIIGLDRAALGESYMDGDFECDDLVAFCVKTVASKYMINPKSLMVSSIFNSLPLLMFNMQTKKRSQKDISFHYDLGNDLFRLMLDKAMNYSCGYWHRNINLISDQTSDKDNLCETLDEAQMNKMLLIGKKLDLKPGMKVLDIGSGWGFLVKFLAINYDVDVIGVTLSKEQHNFAIENFTNKDELDFLRVPHLNPNGTGSFKFELKDYRDVKDTFDRIVSVGMLEHVGKKNYKEYFNVGHRCLKDDGLFLVHTIGIAQKYMPQVDPWVNKYIFPGGMVPYPTQLIKATFGKFVIEDWHNMGYNYYRTLKAWNENFQKNWPQLSEKYDERFKRMWTFYLCISAALFAARKVNLWQVVLSKDGYAGGYVSYR